MSLDGIKSKADLAAVVMEKGLAHVCLVTSPRPSVKDKITWVIPKKSRDSLIQYNDAVEKFFRLLMKAILRHVDFQVVQIVLIASPGATKDQFLAFVKKSKNQALLRNLDKFVRAPSSGGDLSSLKEALQDKGLQNRLIAVRAAEQQNSLDSFLKLLREKPQQACYGVAHVTRAAKACAIDTLLISEQLLVSAGQKFTKLVDSVHKNGGQVKAFSSEHDSDEELMKMTGVCAMLRFPVSEEYGTY